jgi:pantoate--beta-alanine ligase
MSSRNGYLTPKARVQAPQLHHALQQVVQEVQAKQQDYAVAVAKAAALLTHSGWIVDYVSIRSAHSLLLPAQEENDLVVLGAARLGSTRLIDNIEFKQA